MRTGFVSKIGPLSVERITGVMRTGSAIDTSKPATGGGHTTESNGNWDSPISVYRSGLTAPHLQLQGKRVGQAVPFGEMAAAFENDAGGVETNRWCRCQIEVVANSQEELWLPDKATVDSLAHIIAWAKPNLGIPISRPFDSDDLGPQPWATEDYKRRHADKWGNTAGWFMHVEIPENAHWDMGEIKWSVILKRAIEIVKGTVRTLILTTPFMTGPDVKAAEDLLRNNRFGNFAPGGLAGTYDLETAQATWRAKHFLGYPEADINVNFGPALKAYLDGSEKLPAAYRARRIKRISSHRFKTPQFDAGRDVH
jgi:hypothetical protein